MSDDKTMQEAVIAVINTEKGQWTEAKRDLQRAIEDYFTHGHPNYRDLSALKKAHQRYEKSK